MRRVVIAACLALAFVNGANTNVADRFAQFKLAYGRKYASVAEEARRFRIFAQNMERAAALQASNPGATFGVNEFSDLSAHEMKRRHNADEYYRRRIVEASNEETMVMSAEQKLSAQGRSVDWRPKGAVTPVKNQGDCGSCWSFSTTGGIEGQWFLAGNPLTSLSEQELVSCDTIDSGCNGGLMDNAFTWLLNNKNGSIVTEASYPYVSGSGAVPTCSLAGTKFGAQISAFKNIEKNEDAMAAFVFASGPLSIAVDATSWQTYTGGIMSNCVSQQLDHGVLIVGFDDTNSPPYWIIKNSWGRTWGENGYIRVQKGTNQCLLTSAPCTSIVSATPNTPAPGPSALTFEQKTCIDQPCKTCTAMTLPQNECITASHSSYLASCATDGLIVTAFSTRNCTGASQITVNPINVCSVVFRKTGDERFVENICPPTTPAPTQAPPTPAPTGAPPTPAPTPAPPTPAPTFPSGWIDLFPPPYQNAPSIMMAISALNNATQYVPGGSNGAGFTVFEFNGEENGQFTPLNMPDQALMIMALAAGGTTEVPKGVVGGFGIGNGIQYFVNATTLLPSKIPTLLVTTQDARMSRDGTNALVVDGSGSNNVLFSSDSGATFNEKLVNISVNPNCTNVRYGAMASASTYYVTFASWPNTQSRKSKKSYQLSETRFAERQADGKMKIRRRMPKRLGAGSGSSSQSGGCPYAAAIAKTTDGGNTWIAQVNIPNGNFYFNGVDCFGVNHCIAVGEGFNEGAGGHIWLTEDGTNWKEVFFMASTSAGQYSFMSVMFSGSTGKEAWVGGSLQISQVAAKGLFFHTSDGGHTWKEYPHGLPNLGDITSLSMLPDGKGFATAITIYDDSTILRYDPNGPPPPGYFKQMQCSGANCTGMCQNASFPQQMCLQLNGGGSAIATCTSTALVQQVFQTSDCTGSSNSSSLALNVCVTQSGSSFETFCPSSQQDPEFADLPPRGKRLFTV